MDATHTPEQAESAVERRESGQEKRRRSGVVVSICGARATVAARMSDLMTEDGQFWSVGDLVAIYGARSRVICLVQDMTSDTRGWDPNAENLVHANVELLGEVTDIGGRPVFRRGIASYPALGALVSRIRESDFVAIYDLGTRKATVIGQLVQAQIPAAVDIDAMLRQHFAVVGTTGVGKSSSIAILLRAALAERPNLRAVILDPHNEYTHAFREESASVEAKRFELPFWLFQFEEFVEVLYRGAQAPAEELEILREATIKAQDDYAGGDRATSIMKRTFRADDLGVDAVRPYRINDVITIIDNEIGRLEPRYSRYSLRGLKVRLEAITNDRAFRFMFGRAAIEAQPDFVSRSLFRLNDVDKRVTILRMAGIPSDVVNASVSVLSRLAFDLCVSRRGEQELLLVCEEAHRYVPADSSLGFSPTRRAIARIAKEGRKYGCFLSIVTQRPAELDPTILSQCSTVFAMRLANSADQAIMRSAIPDNSGGALEFISSLNNRECIAFGEAVATAMRLVFMEQQEGKLPKMLADWETTTDAHDVAPPPPQDLLANDRSPDPITAPLPMPRRVSRPEGGSLTLDWPPQERRPFGR